MLISFKKKASAAKLLQVYISKLNTEMIDRLRYLKDPSTETEKSQAATQRDMFLMSDNIYVLCFVMY